MTDHLNAIKATIPAGDPSSKDRMEWCKAAAAAIADVCFEHSQNQTKGDASITPHDNAVDAMFGVQLCMGNTRNYLIAKLKGK